MTPTWAATCVGADTSAGGHPALVRAVAVAGPFGVGIFGDNRGHMLDTHAVARSLTDAEFTPAQADAITNAVRQAAEQGDQVTSDQFKTGLAELRTEMAGQRVDLTGQIAEVAGEVAEVRTEIANLDTRISTQIAGGRTSPTCAPSSGRTSPACAPRLRTSRGAELVSTAPRRR